jgi:APA family basic amino acid/polyamine antiporter
MIPILILTKNESISAQVTYIIDFSVIAFLMVYFICCLAFLKIVIRERSTIKTIVGIAALAFCALMIADASIEAICISLMFFASGIFIPLAKNKAPKTKTVVA